MDSYHTTKAKQNCCEMFSEALGNEPAKQLLKTSFIRHFASQHEMNECNTHQAKMHCTEIFGEPLSKEPAIRSFVC